MKPRIEELTPQLRRVSLYKLCVDMPVVHVELGVS
jgi:hypothetical protein